MKGFHAMPIACAQFETDASCCSPVVHLSVVACGDRLNESMVMLKSASLFTRAPLHAHIFAEDELRPLFEEQVLLYFVNFILLT